MSARSLRLVPPEKSSVEPILALLDAAILARPVSPAMADVFMALDEHLTALLETLIDAIPLLPQAQRDWAMEEVVYCRAAPLLDQLPVARARLLQLVRSAGEPVKRIAGTIGMVLRFPETVQVSLCAEALDALSRLDAEYERAWLLRNLAVVLPEAGDAALSLRQKARATAEALQDPALRAEALGALR